VTYSIVGRDAATGELGVGVQSQAFNTGAAVPWAWPGVGAVATQSFTDRRYGWRGLELLAAGGAPVDVLAELTAPDELRAFRQVGMIDPQGRTAQFTGEHCIPCAGHAAGDGWAAQGNMLAAEAWYELGRAFESTPGTLAQRLMAALDAAEATGGDWRGRGGAAILVVPAEGEPWERIIDLRVEEGDGSLVELRRLLERAEAYRASNRAEPGTGRCGSRPARGLRQGARGPRRRAGRRRGRRTARARRAGSRAAALARLRALPLAPSRVASLAGDSRRVTSRSCPLLSGSPTIPRRAS
jgi:uncharacterized Ntn-hydrolase superfamily protein